MKYITVNWKAVNKAISENDCGQLRSEQAQIKKLIDTKLNDAYIERRKQEELNKIKALKELPIDSDVIYTGRSSDIKFGEIGKKKKDGRSRMTAEFNGKRWSVYYTNLKQDQLTSDELNSRKVTDRISELLIGKL